jgi:hypothetical protein
MKVRFNVKGYIDRRTPELIARYEHSQGRHVESGRPVPLVKGVGNVDSHGSGDSTRGSRTARIWPATAAAPFRVVRVR